MAKIGDGFQIGLSWIPIDSRRVPHGAIEVEEGIFVARSEFEGEMVPGKYVERYQTCYVPHGGKEHELSNCDILCDTSLGCDGTW